MNKNIKKFVFAALLGTVAFTSCNKYLDVNENPNNPEKVEPNLLLPTVEAGLSQIVGNQLQVYGGLWAQYWTQSPSSSQYQVIDQYNLKTTNTDRVWATIYRSTLNNAEIIINSEKGVNNYTIGMAYLLKAYTLQVATDAFGDIPLNDALQGASNLNPKYQTQKEVYTAIFENIDKGIELLKGSLGTSPGEQDMFFNGDNDEWIKFANTLKLRGYLRISSVDAATAQAGIKALYATNPTFVDGDVSIAFTTTGGNQNPFYTETVGLDYVQNVVASGTSVQAMKGISDDRLFKLYDKLSGQDTIAYLLQGDFRGQNTKLVSPPSALTGANARSTISAVAPVKIFSKTESLFLQAEAVSKGWAAGDAKTLYEDAIRASFSGLGLNASTYLANSSVTFPVGKSKEEQLKAIITQKYFALNGFQNFEAWTEYRRTGYPDFLIQSKASIIGAGQMPQRLLYPNSELTSNSNYPGTKIITERVWWDVK
ncbi:MULTISPECIES: SusD/RagB family nutrient-binding outer membrane lipoprotein [Sphingobacterium]|uniref:SusD/RagB family nutrient-binding outer membrane lipoprotein n=1 Tax=Sphingobacterium TaxID=28453 RepID=UPI00257A9563|nr:MULTISPECIES: SusD/RagB family nutrient-binding outer membrane lipoprotein [Sphingobacterium]